MTEATYKDMPLSELIAASPQRRRRGGVTDSEERKKEKHRRLIETRRLALQGLARLHSEDYDRLHREARDIVDQKWGDLPE